MGLPDVLEQAKRQASDSYGTRLGFKAASEVVSMDEPPAECAAQKKDSSLRVAIELVKSGEADACVSSGNTGALMATARYVLKTLPGIDRPAIISAVPGVKGPTYMLDLGANVGCTLAAPLPIRVDGLRRRRATCSRSRGRASGSSTSGQEDIKGNETVREAGELLAAQRLNYVGFVEGDGIFHADVDVVVSDGFVGNVALEDDGRRRANDQLFPEGGVSHEPAARRAGAHCAIGARGECASGSIRAAITARASSG